MINAAFSYHGEGVGTVMGRVRVLGRVRVGVVHAVQQCVSPR